MATDDPNIDGVAEAARIIRELLKQIDAGAIEATPARTWHLRGVLDALETLQKGGEWNKLSKEDT